MDKNIPEYDFPLTIFSNTSRPAKSISDLREQPCPLRGERQARSALQDREEHLCAGQRQRQRRKARPLPAQATRPPGLGGPSLGTGGTTYGLDSGPLDAGQGKPVCFPPQEGPPCL